ncbi:MAG: transglutaminase family protein [Acidimicrobiales bacterium]
MDIDQRFTELVQRCGSELPLDEAALCIAAAGQPARALDVDAQLARLDRIASQCQDATVDGVCELLYGRLGLRGAQHDYDDPRHSFLDQVLDRGVGIPISLAVLAIEVGRRAGVAIQGVGMPGHFLLVEAGQPDHPGQPSRFVDAFGGGRRLDEDGCQDLFGRLFGPGAPWSPALLRPTPPRAIVARMLANLTASYRTRQDRAGRVWVATWRAAIPGRPLGETAPLADELAQLGLIDRAADVLEAAAAGLGVPATATTLRAQATALRARLN